MHMQFGNAVNGSISLCKAVLSALALLSVVANSSSIQAQVSHYTESDRYPEYFSALTHKLNKEPHPKILSFGCANGSEAQALRMYMTNAKVDGVDIDKDLISKNKESNTDSHIRYYDNVSHLSAAYYDAVTMMHVLEYFSSLHEIDYFKRARFPFDTFERLLALVDPLLVDGGYLLIYNSNYRFDDSSLANNYKRVGPMLSSGCGFQYSADGALLSDWDLCTDQSLLNQGRCIGCKHICCNGTEYPWVFFQKIKLNGDAGMDIQDKTEITPGTFAIRTTSNSSGISAMTGFAMGMCVLLSGFVLFKVRRSHEIRTGSVYYSSGRSSVISVSDKCEQPEYAQKLFEAN